MKNRKLTENIRTNRIVLSKNGESYGKEVPVRIFVLGGSDSKITQFNSFYEDEIAYNKIKDHVILAQIIMFEGKHVSIEQSPVINDKYSRWTKIATIESTQKVWRYLNFFKFEDLIESGALFFNRLDRFSDKLEGVSPESCEQSILETPTNKTIEEKLENIRLMKERFKFCRKSTFTSCWHINDKISDLMWHEYGNERDSIAIETTYDNLISAKDQIQLPIHVERIRYFDEPYVNQESYWFPFLFKRRNQFEWENELRISFYGYNFSNLEHLKIKVPLKLFIKRIHLSPLAKKHELIMLKKLLKSKNLYFPIYFNGKKVS